MNPLMGMGSYSMPNLADLMMLTSEKLLGTLKIIAAAKNKENSHTWNPG